MMSEEGLRKLQGKLARAEREGDFFSMAQGYIILADLLLRKGNRRLSRIFIERAGECLRETAPAAWVRPMIHSFRGLRLHRGGIAPKEAEKAVAAPAEIDR